MEILVVQMEQRRTDGSAANYEEPCATGGSVGNLIQAPVEVDFYNSGSYFNPDEAPVLAQSAMLALAAARHEVASLLVETRPEYVSPPRGSSGR